MEINKDGKVFIGAMVVLVSVIIGVAYKVTNKDGVSLFSNIGSAVNNSSKQNTMTITNADGLQMTDEVVGTGAAATAGHKVTVHYTGTLTNGKKFDSSLDRGTPFTFDLGAGQVIKGWDEGVAGMKVGGKRKLTIPPELGYGAQSVGNGLIPANSTLIFEVELLDVK